MQEIFLHDKQPPKISYPAKEQRCNAIIDPISGASLEYRHLIQNDQTRRTWNRSFANELGRLANGVGDRIKGTNIIKFIPKTAVPPGRKVTYGRMVVNYRSDKTEPNRTRLTVGRDKIDYPSAVRTDTADMIAAKLLLNSVISTPRAQCCILDIKDFYLNNKLLWYEYMTIALKLIPKEIIDEYNLTNIVHDGTIDLYTSKSKKACKDCHRPEKLPTMNFKTMCAHLDTNHVHKLQDCGPTIVA